MIPRAQLNPTPDLTSLPANDFELDLLILKISQKLEKTSFFMLNHKSDGWSLFMQKSKDSSGLKKKEALVVLTLAILTVTAMGASTLPQTRTATLVNRLLRTHFNNRHIQNLFESISKTLPLASQGVQSLFQGYEGSDGAVQNLAKSLADTAHESMGRYQTQVKDLQQLVSTLARTRAQCKQIR